MDIKELKFLDIQNTVSKPSCGQAAVSESSVIPSGHRGQSNSSSSHNSTATVTILRRREYSGDLWFNHPHVGLGDIEI